MADRKERLRARALDLARQALDQAPVHPEHRHGLIVGFAIDRPGGTGDLAVIAVIQGLDEPAWITLDPDDVAAIIRYAELGNGWTPDDQAERLN